MSGGGAQHASKGDSEGKASVWSWAQRQFGSALSRQEGETRGSATGFSLGYYPGASSKWMGK